MFALRCFAHTANVFVVAAAVDVVIPFNLLHYNEEKRVMDTRSVQLEPDWHDRMRRVTDF